MEDNRTNPDDEGNYLGTEFYYYSGTVLEGTRKFCEEKVGHYFHYKEIMDWAELEWDGKIPGTDEKSIFKNLGGVCMKDEGCHHVLMPVSAVVVDLEDLKRNIKKGYFNPDELEIEMLGL